MEPLVDIVIEDDRWEAFGLETLSDRAVRVITATSASEILPRFATTPTHMECKFCAWQDRCWGTQ